jgi:ABC-type proline/glycine betaine transport system ATPase subunit
MSADVKFDNIWVKFGSFVAARDVNIHIQEGEFYTILGPSGCGDDPASLCVRFPESIGGEHFYRW